MAKKLKSKIKELCGFDGLPANEKYKLAAQILNDKVYKQQLCNKVLGLTFKDIDKVMNSILAEKKPSSSEEEICPEKYGIQPEEDEYFHSNNGGGSSGIIEYRAPTRKEVAELIAASKAPCVTPHTTESPRPYRTYTREEVCDLLNGSYDPQKYSKAKTFKKV